MIMYIQTRTIHKRTTLEDPTTLQTLRKLIHWLRINYIISYIYIHSANVQDKSFKLLPKVNSLVADLLIFNNIYVCSESTCFFG